MGISKIVETVRPHSLDGVPSNFTQNIRTCHFSNTAHKNTMSQIGMFLITSLNSRDSFLSNKQYSAMICAYWSLYPCWFLLLLPIQVHLLWDIQCYQPQSVWRDWMHQSDWRQVLLWLECWCPCNMETWLGEMLLEYEPEKYKHKLHWIHVVSWVKVFY